MHVSTMPQFFSKVEVPANSPRSHFTVAWRNWEWAASQTLPASVSMVIVKLDDSIIMKKTEQVWLVQHS